MLSNATGCSNCSKNLHRGGFSTCWIQTCHQICYLTNKAIQALNSWLPTEGWCKVEEFVCYTLKFASFSSKPTDLSSIPDYLVPSAKFSTDNWYGFRKGRVLICNINTPLPLCEKIPLKNLILQNWITLSNMDWEFRVDYIFWRQARKVYLLYILSHALCNGCNVQTPSLCSYYGLYHYYCVITIIVSWHLAFDTHAIRMLSYNIASC